MAKLNIDPEAMQDYYESLGIHYEEQDDWARARAVDIECEAKSRPPAKGSQEARDRMAKVRAAKEAKKDVRDEDDD